MKILIINCFDTYEHRVTLLQQVFTEMGHKISVVASNFRHFQKVFREDTVEGFIFVPVKPYYKNLSAARLISHDRFAKGALKCASDMQPDLLWILAPPNSLVKYGAAYKKAHPQVKLIFDFIDMWPETMPISKFKNLPPFTFWKSLRDCWVDTADAVVTECNLYRSLLEKCCRAEKIHTLYLARELRPNLSHPNLSQDRISLCYLGSINNIIDIPLIGQIIRQFSQPVDLHIIGDGEKRNELIEEAKRAGATIIFHGKIYDPTEKQAIFDKCHFGLNIMKENVFVGLTMKSIDYFEGGLPIINNIRGDTWEFVEYYKIGVNYDATACLKQDVLSLLQYQRHSIRAFFETSFSKEMFANTTAQIICSVLTCAKN